MTKIDYIRSEWFVGQDHQGGFVSARWGYFLTYPLWKLIAPMSDFRMYTNEWVYKLTSELWWAYSQWNRLMFWAYIQRTKC